MAGMMEAMLQARANSELEFDAGTRPNEEAGFSVLGLRAGRTLEYASLAGRVHPDDSAVRATAIQHALETGGSHEAEFRIILPDDSVRWIAARGRRPSPAVNDAVPRVLGVSMDITRQKQAGQRLCRVATGQGGRAQSVGPLSPHPGGGWK